MKKLSISTLYILVMVTLVAWGSKKAVKEDINNDRLATENN